MRRLLSIAAYSALGLSVLALLILNALAWTGGLAEDDTTATPSTTEAAPPPPPAPPPAPAPASPPPPATEPVSSQRKKPSRAPTLLITATRGDCWIEARVGSAEGETLYAGTLATGNSLRFSRPRVWLRLGAASNVDMVVNGRPSAIPSGTVELTVPEV